MIATRALMHPLSLAAIVLLAVNDHVLKAAWPGVITGKLSDFAGLAFFPLVLAAAAEQIGIRRGARSTVAARAVGDTGARAVHVAAIATAIAFSAVKLGPASDVYRVGLAALQWPFRALHAVITGEGVPALRSVALVADPTDLVALVALAVPILLAGAAARTIRRASGGSVASHAVRALPL